MKIIVTIGGGIVAAVVFEQYPCILVEVRDYDIEGTDRISDLERGYSMDIYTP